MNQERSLKMPAEWEQQSAVWLSWPHNVETWPTNLAEAQHEFVELVKTIADHQPVRVLCGGAANQQAVAALPRIQNIELVDIPTNDAWARDYAPTFVRETGTGSLLAIDWHYNAWGGKYPPYDQDQLVAARVASELKIETISPNFCFEGGAIEINDSGILLTTRSCALDPNRNPGATVESVEVILKQNLGATRIIWLSGDAIEGDDTDGHIDQLARYTDNETIVHAWCDDPDDPQFAPLASNLTDLQNAMKTCQPECELIPLAIPGPINYCDRRIPASYCNFLITNQKVIVPQFGISRTDHQAIETLKPLFPDRDVVGLNSLNLSVGLGSFHCLSQQQPESHPTNR